MICFLLSFLFLPFTILATPITLGEVGNLTFAELTNSTGDAQHRQTCPAPPSDATPIAFGFDKIGVSGMCTHETQLAYDFPTHSSLAGSKPIL